MQNFHISENTEIQNLEILNNACMFIDMYVYRQTNVSVCLRTMCQYQACISLHVCMYVLPSNQMEYCAIAMNASLDPELLLNGVFNHCESMPL